MAVDLVSQLRARLNDERVGRTAFRFACVDSNANDCLIGLTTGSVFTTQVMRGRDARPLSVDLTDPRYSTIRKLIEYLQAQPGYQVTIERDYEEDRPSTDLRVIGSVSCLNFAVPFRHHIFADSELEELLKQACRRHNVNYTPATLPAAEEEFVLQLAAAGGHRLLAGDAAKRSGMEFTVDQLLGLANNLEDAYNRDVKRQHRALPVATPLDEADKGRGEIITSNSFRRSLRSGMMGPLGAALPPIAPILSVLDEEVEDTKVTLRWTKNRDESFYAYEIWRDTRPNIVRPANVSLVTDVPEVLHDNVKRVYTAKLCFRSSGPYSVRDRANATAILSESGGQTAIGFTDVGYTTENPRWLGPATAPPLEPSTTYYYRMFVSSVNGEMISTNEVSVTTKTQRPLFASLSPIDPLLGPAGTVVSIAGTGFVSTMKGYIDSKLVSLTIVSPTEALFTVPTFSNPNALGLRYDIIIEDGVTGLIDVLGNGFMLTAP